MADKAFALACCCGPVTVPNKSVALGSNVSFTACATGRLYLGINDDFYPDNGTDPIYISINPGINVVIDSRAVYDSGMNVVRGQRYVVNATGRVNIGTCRFPGPSPSIYSLDGQFISGTPCSPGSPPLVPNAVAYSLIGIIAPPGGDPYAANSSC